MFFLHVIDTLTAGLVCGSLLMANVFVKQYVWTLEEVAYSLDTNMTVGNSLFIKTVEIDRKEDFPKVPMGFCGNDLLLKATCRVGRLPVKNTFAEHSRLQSLKNAVFWVY